MQNIDTLQRFFTDSHQSVADPFAVKPHRVVGTDEPLISVFPIEGAGPFFLEYEEWLESDAPFYPENHYDPRETYSWDLGPGKREAGVGEIEAVGRIPGFEEARTHSGRERPRHREIAVGTQPHRVLRLIKAAHGDAKSLNYVGAEDKYATAKAWTGEFRTLISADWDYLTAHLPAVEVQPGRGGDAPEKADV